MFAYNDKDLEKITIEKNRIIEILNIRSKEIKLSDFNEQSEFMFGEILSMKIKYYLNKMIIPTFACVKNSDVDEQRAYYANYLIRLLGSFLDMYAQVLNNYYGLKLNPLKKHYQSSIFEKENTIHKFLKQKSIENYNIVTVNRVMKNLDENYHSNEAFVNIKDILNKDIIRNILLDLRNYETHFQSIFSMYNMYYDPTTMLRSMSFNNTHDFIDKEEFTDFLNITEKIILLYIDLIVQFEFMYKNRKMIEKKFDVSSHVFTSTCLKCGNKFLIDKINFELIKTKNLKLKCFSDSCNGVQSLEFSEKIEVHPEKEYKIMIEFINKFENHLCEE